jgi:hypothetical protein
LALALSIEKEKDPRSVDSEWIQVSGLTGDFLIQLTGDFLIQTAAWLRAFGRRLPFSPSKAGYPSPGIAISDEGEAYSNGRLIEPQ